MKKNLKLLLVSIFFLPVVLITTTAQDVKLTKFVIGSGGSVGQTVQMDNGKQLILNGTFAQTAVEQKMGSGGAGAPVNLYEGFWTPQPTVITDVEDQPNSANSLSNYPNPFSESTNIRFSLEQASYVTIRVYDINGALVNTVLSNEIKQPGNDLSVQWVAQDQFGAPLSSGSYLYELSIEPLNSGRSFSLRNVMVIVK